MTISEKLKILSQQKKKALTPFSMVGDPDMDTSLEIFSRMSDWGADFAELGIPYSDPLMDGPTLQRSHRRALNAGFKLARLPQFIERIRKRSDLPLLIMTCFNPIFKYGAKRFFEDVSSAGVSALLVTDLPPEEWGENLELAAQHGLGTIFLLTPTTTPERMRLLDRVSNPFVYCVSKVGVTGTGDSLPPELKDFTESVRKIITKPMLIGFGISTPRHAREAAALADGVIIGSAVAAMIETNIGDNETLLKELGGFLSSARQEMDR